ncbi:uncharacterized protein LOC127791548 [Diospyros lotus]|uniref:uncharacterized protein LOC127791548 n=1 Tax=Diospyros lotus TaxID=55363 RepID=UPI00224E35BC|nr:uncharacterized protein LOC127791548 [Diospyros lotus]
MSNINRRMIHEKVQDDEEEEAIVTTLVEHHIQSGDHGSVSRRHGFVMNRCVINRNRVEGHERLYRDYFGDSPTYPPHLFRRRFCMRQSLFLQIQVAIESHDSYFGQRYNAAGVLGLSSLQKIIAALRMLAYGSPADVVDEYVRISESTAVESLKRFVKAVVEVFGEQYLRRLNSIDIARLMTVAEQREFLGMLGSVDCMHWKWTNCPTAWHGMYTGHAREPTIILEAIASYDLWIWHAFFGLPGSLNDINVLDTSHVFLELAEGCGPEVKYTINGHEYTMGYYLADGIYPSWSTFVKTIPSPQENKAKFFAAQQESARKDVERAFGVLQSQFAIVRGPGHFWDVQTLKDIMTTCIILHNTIVEDERGTVYEGVDSEYDIVAGTPTIELSRNRTNEIRDFI